MASFASGLRVLLEEREDVGHSRLDDGAVRDSGVFLVLVIHLEFLAIYDLTHNLTHA